MSAFEIMLNQCEKQAEKLCSINIDDDYINEIDIFNNYFIQLQQIIESDTSLHDKNKVANLLELLNNIIKRVQENQNVSAAYIDNLKKNKNMVGYGAVKQFSHRINRRY